jgi:hypothetical protein
VGREAVDRKSQKNHLHVELDYSRTLGANSHHSSEKNAGQLPHNMTLFGVLIFFFVNNGYSWFDDYL